MSPDELRKWAHQNIYVPSQVNHIDVAADEWDLAIKQANYAKDDKVVMQNVIDVQKARIGELRAHMRLQASMIRLQPADQILDLRVYLDGLADALAALAGEEKT